MTSSVSMSQQATSHAGISSVIDDEVQVSQWRETYVFPLFAESFRRIGLPSPFYALLMVVLDLQIVVTSMVLGSSNLWPNPPTFYRIVYYFIDWGVTNRVYQEIIPQLALGLIIYGMIIGIFSFLFIYFYLHRTYTNWQLIMVNIIYSILIPIITPFYGSTAGNLLYQAFRNGNAGTIGFLVIYLVMFVLIVVVDSYVSVITDYSCLLTKHPFACWDYRYNLTVHLLIPCSAFLQPILVLLAGWMSELLIIIQFAVYLFLFYLLYFLPKQVYICNAQSAALIIFGLFSSLLQFVHFFVPNKIPVYIYMVVPVIIGMIGTGVCCVIYNKRRDKIIYRLSTKAIADENQINEITKRDLFDSFVFSSIDDAITYIHIGLTNNCDFFLDFSFLRYMLESYAKPEIIFAIAQMAANFPSELQFFSYCLSIISKMDFTNVGQHFMVYQMKRIHVIRQSSVSQDASQRLFILQKQSAECISNIRGFWLEILNAKKRISFASLMYLRIITSDTQFAFLDAIENFPNNTALLTEYSRFQIEALGDFSGSVITGKKLSLIDQGKTLVVDYAFKSFVNAYPQYLHQRILNVHGQIVSDKIDHVESISSISESSSNSSSNDQYDERNDDIIRQYFDHGKLRLALQAKLSTVEMPSIPIAIFMAVSQFFCCIFVYSLIIALCPIGTKKSIKLYGLLDKIAKIALTIQYNTICASMNYFKDNGDFSGINHILANLNINMDDLSQTPSLLYKPEMSVYLSTAQLFLQYRQVVFSMIEYKVSDIFAFFSEKAYKFYEVTSANKVILLDIISPRNYIIQFVNLFYSNHQVYNQSHALYGLLVKQEIIDSLSMMDSLSDIQNIIAENGNKNTKKVQLIMKIIVLGVAMVCLVFFTCLRILNIWNLNKESNQRSELLKKFSPEIIKESLEPISLKHKDRKIRGSSIHGAHDVDKHIIIYPLDVVFSICVALGLVVGSVMLYVKNLGMENDLYNLLRFNSMRYMNLAGSVISVLAAKANITTQAASEEMCFDYYNKSKSSHANLIKSLITGDKVLLKDYFAGVNTPDVDDYACNLKSMTINNRFNEMMTSIATILANKSFDLDDLTYSELIFNMNEYFFMDFIKLDNDIIEFAEDYYDRIKKTLYLMAIIGMVIAFVVFCVEFIFIIAFKQANAAINQLLLMLPPVALVQTPAFIKMLFKKNIKDDDFTMTPSQTILSASSNAAMILDKNLIIQTINEAFKCITGFMPDQILGQPLTFLIPNDAKSSCSGDEEDSSQLYLLIDKAREGSEEVQVVKIRCLTENGSSISLKATLVPIFDPDTKEIDSFGILCRDLSKEVVQKNMIKEAKRRVDKLLECLIPPEVLSIVRGNKGSSLFYSDIATVIFIEICGLTFYVHTMSPSQMMQNLNTIYKHFDHAADNFPAVHRLKTNDDLFLAVCGLFDFIGNPQVQVDQAVGFSLDLLDRIEEINEELDIDLHLRIGINVGGPLCGSVLSPQTPSFDILGGVIGLAVKMQSDGPEDVVQVSKSVLEYLDKNKYDIEEGQVLLGARGIPDPTYIIKMK